MPYSVPTQAHRILALTAAATLPKIQLVTVTPSFVGRSPNANPSLDVSWTAVDDPAVSYVVRYSRSAGTVTAPPDGAGQMSADKDSVTLSANLAPYKWNPYMYYIWVAAVSTGVPMGEYSNRTQGLTPTSEPDTSVCRHFCACVSWSCMHVNWVKLCFFYVHVTLLYTFFQSSSKVQWIYVIPLCLELS